MEMLFIEQNRVLRLNMLDCQTAMRHPKYIPNASNALNVNHMAIELSKETRKAAVSSIERYFDANMEEKIGNVAADALLQFFIEEIGPSIYNKAVSDVQTRMQSRVMELDVEVYEDEFRYWNKRQPKR